MLRLGSSQPWQDAMQQIAGTRENDAQALMDYFKPLTDWLIEQNKGHNITWEESCPTFPLVTVSQPSSTTRVIPSVFTVILLFAFVFIK